MSIIWQNERKIFEESGVGGGTVGVLSEQLGRKLTFSLQSEETVKTIVPPERLLVLDLEKGFGFKEICEYLECPVSDGEYPRSNALAEFNAAAEYILAPAIRKTKMMFSTTVIGISAVALGWYLRRHR